MKTVSLVIPTYSRPDDLRRLIKSIASSDVPKDELEIIVVDNAGDLAAEAIQKAAGPIRLQVVRPGANLYCSGGRRFGAKYASGKLLFFVDDDNILAPDCIHHLVRGFEDNPALGQAGPLMLIYNDKNRIWAAGARINRWGMAFHIAAGQDVLAMELPDVIRGIDYIPNAFMVSREAFDAVPFDTDTFPHNWSEPDFGLRLKSHGFESATITRARDWHDINYDNGGHITRVDSRKIYDQTKSRIQFRRRFFSSPGAWLIFWGAVFPTSTLYYIKAIAASADPHKLGMLGHYFKGTIDGLKAPLKSPGTPTYGASTEQT